MGAVIFALVGCAASYFGGLSWWWLFAWVPGGLLTEAIARTGGGADLLDALADALFIFVILGEIGEIFESFGGGE